MDGEDHPHLTSRHKSHVDKASQLIVCYIECSYVLTDLFLEVQGHSEI